MEACDVRPLDGRVGVSAKLAPHLHGSVEHTLSFSRLLVDQEPDSTFPWLKCHGVQGTPFPTRKGVNFQGDRRPVQVTFSPEDPGSSDGSKFLLVRRTADREKVWLLNRLMEDFCHRGRDEATFCGVSFYQGVGAPDKIEGIPDRYTRISDVLDQGRKCLSLFEVIDCSLGVHRAEKGYTGVGVTCLSDSKKPGWVFKVLDALRQHKVEREAFRRLDNFDERENSGDHNGDGSHGRRDDLA